MNLAGTQIKDTYGNLITIGTVAGTPTTGALENGAGSGITALTMTNTTLEGGLIINESGADVDFRVEGDTDANLLFVDASTNRVGIGTATPAFLLDVDGELGVNGNINLKGSFSRSIELLNGNSTSNIRFDFPELTTAVGFLTFYRQTNTTGDKQLQIYKGDGTSTLQSILNADGNSYLNASAGNVGIGTSSPSAKLHVEGSAIFNDAGADVDFRVEGDTNTHLIFADASVDKVMIGGSSSGGGGRLEVVGGSIGVKNIYGTSGFKTIVGTFTALANTTSTATIDLKLNNLIGGFQCHVGAYISGAQGEGQLFFTGGGRFGTNTAHNDIHVIRNSTPDGDLTFGTPVHTGANNTITFTIANADLSLNCTLFIYLTVFGDSFTADPTITIS